MDENIRKEMRDHAWSYFVLHADQRLRTFHFYLILATVIIGAAATVTKDGTGHVPAGVLALALSFLSFVFWKLDVRNKQLIKHGEEAVKLVEGESGLQDDGEVPHRLKLFLHEEYATGKLKRSPRIWPWPAYFSYSTSFNAVFLVFGLCGLIGGLILLS
jgi:hypothetical protein